MQHVRRSVLSVIVAFATILIATPVASTAAQDVPPPQPMGIPCANGASVQLLKASPIGEGDQLLLLGRVILEPGGGIGAHKNLTLMNVAVESGSFGFTLLTEDAEMTVTRAATEDTEATEEQVVPGEQVTLNPGDAYTAPTGAVHTGTNLSDGETTLLFASLAKAGQPIEQCVDAATPVATPAS